MVFIATANQSVFTLSTAIINKPSALVTVDGVVQPTSEYSLNMTGTQLTLSEGVPVGTIVRVLALGVASAGAPADDTVTTAKLRDGAVTTEKLGDGAVTMAKLAAALQAMLSPTGAVQYFAGSTAPTGWLKANGAAVSRTTYATLFAAIGTTYGVGDNSTTFNLPDLRGEFVRGWDDGRGVDSSRSFGSAQSDAFKSHTHTYSATLGLVSLQGDNTGADDYARTSSGTTDSTGGTETRPRNIALLACIKS
jgi:microcystin-dependent protein